MYDAKTYMCVIPARLPSPYLARVGMFDCHSHVEYHDSENPSNEFPYMLMNLMLPLPAFAYVKLNRDGTGLVEET